MRPSERPERTGRTPATLNPLAIALASALLVGCPGAEGVRQVPVRPPSSDLLAAAPFDDPDEPAPPPALVGGDPDDPAADLLERHNRLRADRDRPSLVLSEALNEAARDQARGMVSMGKVRHKGPDGSSAAERVERAGYRFTSVGENVAAGQRTAEEVMDGWMGSPGHRRNILGDFREMGAAREVDDNGRPFWCVVFASPMARLDPEEAPAGLLRRINERRDEEDLPPLESVEALAEIARDHCRAMAEAGSLEPEGTPVAEAIREAGVDARRVVRSVAAGASDPARVLDAMLDSPEQRGHLLGPFGLVGIASESADDGTPYWCLVLVEAPEGDDP